jgi:hypothetical protein
LNDDPLIDVIECFTTAEAELARAHLAAEGIESAVAADDIGGMYPGVSLGQIRLLVRRRDLARARQILEAD